MVKITIRDSGWEERRLSDLGYRLKRFLYQEFIPVTKGVALGSGLVTLVLFILARLNLDFSPWIALFPGELPRTPWTLLTYPLFDQSLFSFLFALLWLWFVGGSLERTWGGRRYALLLLAVTLITGLVMSLVGWFVGGMVPIYGLWLPLVGLTWAWAETDPYREVLFWGIIPLKARWLAWLDAILIFTMYLPVHFLMGAASLSGILAFYLFRGRGSAGGYGGGSRNRWNSQNRFRRGRLRVIK